MFVPVRRDHPAGYHVIASDTCAIKKREAIAPCQRKFDQVCASMSNNGQLRVDWRYD